METTHQTSAAKSATCRGKTHGHNIVGSVCTLCGESRQAIDERHQSFQTKSSLYPLPLDLGQIQGTQPVNGMHSDLHDLARTLSELCGEPSFFDLYLGRLKSVGIEQGYRIASEIRDGINRKNIKNPAAIFMSKTKKKPGPY